MGGDAMTPEVTTGVLFEPLTLNKTRLSNRIVMGPMAANSPSSLGAPTDQTVAFFEARARGGVGLIIVGGAIASRRGYEEAPFKPLLRLDVDDFLPDFRRVADAVHAHEVPIIAEIMPSFGRMGVPAPERPIISASPKNVVIPKDRFPAGIHVPMDRITAIPSEATVEEIQQLESDTICAAQRVERAGWDGVEVAAHMSYLLASFLSPRTNWRTDEYGGSAENRARMLSNIVRGIRQITKPEFIVGLRITANDYMPDGQGADGFADIARRVEAEGLDYVSLSAGCYETMDASAPAVDGALVDSGDTDVFKRKLKVPLFIQGIHTPSRAAAAIAGGHGDAIMLARPLLADAEFANKVRHQRIESIVPCTRDNLCIRRMILGMPVRCGANPAMGRESRGTRIIPPVERMLKAPVEHIILKVTGSKGVATLVGKVAGHG